MYQIGNMGNSNGLSVDCKFGQKDNTAICVCTVSDMDGRLLKRFSLSMPLGKIQRKVLSYLANKTGWGWSDVKKSAKRVVKKVTSKKFHQQVNAILNNPKVKSSLAIASTIYPPLGITYATVQQTSNLLMAARGGDPAAQATVVKLAEMAATGDPKAVKISKAMIAMNQMAKEGADVSGWAYNLPFRTNIMAKAMDPSNPFHVMRGMYNEGLTMGMPR